MRILIATHRIPDPPTDGGRQRTALLIRALRAVGDVDFVHINDGAPASGEQLERLRNDYGLVEQVNPVPLNQRGVFRWIPKAPERLAFHATPRSTVYAPDPNVAAVIDRLTAQNEYDLFVGRYLLPTVQAGLIGRRPLILDIDDLDTDVYRSRATANGQSRVVQLVARHHWRQLERLVPPLLKQVDLGFVTNDDDVARLSPLLPVRLLPNIPMVDEAAPTNEPGPGEGANILFVGSLSYRVNRRAVIRFCEQVWPRVHAARPDARLQIVGSGMNDDLRRQLGSIEGVEPIGFVDDLAAAYRDCVFSVVPIFEGGGTKIKVAESLRMGRTVVVSRHSYRGYESLTPDGEGLLVADDDAGLVDRCLRLLGDSNLRGRLAVEGNRLVREKLSFDHFRTIVGEAIDSVVGSVATTSA